MTPTTLRPFLLSIKTWLGLAILLICLFPSHSQAQFQNIYGNGNSNSFHKVIPHGSNFYVLGSDNGQATITRIDQTGAWIWTRRLDIASGWADGAVIPSSGNLYVVGFTLPFNSNNKSLIGEIMPNGTFMCVEALEGPGLEALVRIKINPGGTFSAVGLHTINGLLDVVIYNLSPNCTVNSKKQFFNFVNDNFGNDIEVLPNGDFIVAGSLGNNGIIYQMTSTGQFVTGAQGPGLFNYMDLERRGNGDLLAAANAISSNPPRVIRFDSNLFPVWEVAVNGLTSLDQVIDGSNGNIYVVGTATVNNLARAVVVKMNDNGGLPVLDWARYLENNESGYIGGALAVLPSGNLAFVDGRDSHPNSFGQTDAFMALTNGDLMSDCTLDAFVFLTFENTPFEGPFEPELFEAEFPLEMALSSQGLDYMPAPACATDPCDVNIVATSLDSCGLVQICANASGPSFYKYQWCDGQTTPCFTTQLSCTPQTFCVTLTCSDGSMATATQTFSATDNIPPVALCIPGIGVELDANCEFIVTPGLIDGGSMDNCQIQSMSVTPNLLTGCGVFQVVLTVTDWCNNTSTCTAGIQTVDGDPPTIVCPPNLTLSCNDDTTPNATGFATATDICDPNPTITYSDVVVGMLPCDGLIQRTWTATDSCGNTASCVQLINVMDNVPPTALCNSGITLYLGNPCTATLTSTMLDAGSTDNCQLQSMVVSPNTFTQCGTPLATLTVTDLCGNMASCQQTITVLDTIPPMISCPQDVTTTALFPDCETVVFNIFPGATDNCTVQSINYSISGATTGNGGGDASGQTFQAGTSTVTYTAMDGCGNVDSCSFDLTVECDTCSCLGFANLSFYNFLNLPDIAVSCDSTPVVLPCIGPDALYSFQWALLCSDPFCMQSVDYEIVSASGGPALLNGTAVFPSLSFGPGQLLGPGNYELILTGSCSGDTCICVVNFTLMDCCDCGSFSGMMYEPVQDSTSVSVACGDTLAVDCAQIADLEISGFFHCQGTQCQPYPVLSWDLKDSSGLSIQSGTVQALPGFGLALMPAWFTTPGLYTLTISGQCGGEVCPPCILYLSSPGCNLSFIQCGMAITTFQPPSFDLGDKVLSVRDIRNRIGVPTMTDWAAPEITHPNWTYGDLGAIFGIATDKFNNIFVCATSAYLYSWPNTNFYGLAGSGGIYKIDAITGAPSVFVKTIPGGGPPVIGIAEIPNDLSGLGNISYDEAFHQFFVTNLEDGMIYRINAGTGEILSTFDPFNPDNGTSGIACDGERIWGIGFHNNRIYFSQCNQNTSLGSGNTPNQIFSVGRNVSTGEFDFVNGETLEIVLPAYPPAVVKSNPVSDIEFSSDGKMIIAERTEIGAACFGANPTPTAHESRVLEYIQNTALVWTLSSRQFLVGDRNYGESAAGGVDYGYDSFDPSSNILGDCDSMVWATGDALSISPDVYGIAGIPASGNIWSNDTWIVDADMDLTVNPKTLIGDVDILKCGCPSTCYCGSFTDMFVRGPQGALSQPVTCGGSPVNIGCPTPGMPYTLTGSFQCDGDNCPMETDLDWDLLDPNGASVASGTTKAAPWFVQQFPSGYFLQPGVYTLILAGHCGTDSCPCFIEFMVEEGCPDPCPCDLVDLQAHVNQGFATTLWNTSCKGAFSPLGLNDCDEVEWYIDNPIGTPVGTSTGNQSFCYTFPGAGTYTVYMTVTRKRADGSLCESAVKTQTVNVSCQTIPDCDAAVLSNPRFSEGALAGSLNDMGASEGWNALVGNPTVIEGEPGSHDGWTIQLTGNQDIADVLSHLEPICLEKDTGTISIHLRLFPWGDPHVRENDGKRWDFKAKFYQGDNFELNNCDSMYCLLLGSIDLTPFDTGWATLELPYDLRDWDTPDVCGGVLVRPAVHVSSLFGEVQGADTTRARLQLDNLCLEGTLVGVYDDPRLRNIIRLFPNPTTGALTLRFETISNKERQLQVVDLFGRSIKTEKLSFNLESHTFSLNNFPAGVYMVRIFEEGIPVWVEKVVKY